MKVVIKKPNTSAVIVEVERNNLDLLRALVGDDKPWLCTAVRACGMLSGADLICYCDDEGLLKKLPLNFYRPTDQSPIVGVVVAVKVDQNSDDDLDMTDAEAQSVAIMLDTWSKYSNHLDKEMN